MFAAIVLGLCACSTANFTMIAGESTMRDGHGLAERAAEAEHDGGDDAGAGEGQDGHADHLPARGAEGEGGLLVEARGLQEDLAADRGHDRDDHDGEHDGRR